MGKKEITISNPKGLSKAVPSGTLALKALEALGGIDSKRTVVGVRANNLICDLGKPVTVNSILEPIYLDSREGSKIYRNTFCFVIAMAAKEQFPDRRLIIGNTIGHSFSFYFDGIRHIGEKELEALNNKLKEIIGADEHIEQTVISYQDAEKIFKEQNMAGASQLLLTANDPEVMIARCRNYTDLAHQVLYPSTGILKNYKFSGYRSGFVVLFPREGTADNMGEFYDIPAIATIFEEYRRRGSVLHFSNVGEMNQLVAARKEKNVILMCEMLQNKKISEIAETIASGKDSIKVVLIAGPSSSGKTTFIKKLSTQLDLLGINTMPLSFDDYYVPREQTPKDENGEYDYECPEAIDRELLNKDLIDFFDGKEVNLPTYNFLTGLREYHNNKIKLEKNTILLMEGIHGLNDELTYLVPKEQKFKIYISALTPMNLDDHNKISTSDNRLLRRMVRDYRTRGYDAVETLSRWQSVKSGENKYIFPFQNDADAVFNTALEYEFGVLRNVAMPLLRSVKPYNKEYAEAKRLESLLNKFLNMGMEFIPQDSILREFIGGSVYGH
ncbi:MAG: nucleoside kinase [Spirochaetia bacterium]|nr:nucleoside kinase [Spirochaetia bacterium]